jgi:hypothetical protein
VKPADRVLAFLASGGAIDVRHDGTQVTVRAPGDRERAFVRNVREGESREAMIDRAVRLVEKRSAA